jgi:Phage integrase family
MSDFLSEWGMTLHRLRHSHASHMLAAKIHPKVVQERLGRSSIAIMMDFYSHLMPNMQSEAATAVDAAEPHSRRILWPDGRHCHKRQARADRALGSSGRSEGTRHRPSHHF